MNNIPLHKLSEKFEGRTVMLRYVDGKEQWDGAQYAHRDDYYIFFLMDRARGRMMVDFHEYELHDNIIKFILPGQVHFPVGKVSGRGWMMIADPVFIRSEYKEVLEKAASLGWEHEPSAEKHSELHNMLLAISQRVDSDSRPLSKYIVHDLASSFIGSVADMYTHEMEKNSGSRYQTITIRFKALLDQCYKFMKRPAQYAEKLNITTGYLNEAVNATTGISTGDYIRNHIILHAKRLLFYTDLEVKEIAFDLGYEDTAYFTRLFTRTTSITPSAFRRKYRE